MKFAPEAWPIVLPIASVAIIAGLLASRWESTGLGVSAAFFALLSICIALFFRNPERVPPSDANFVVSPADGRVLATETLEDGRKLVVIFLSVFNVHVNRVPIACEVTKVVSRPGTYLHAGSDAAGTGNARIDVFANSVYGPIKWSQISGLVARKISCRLKTGDRPNTGDEYGLIYFGSRMEVVLPASAEFVCKVGEHAVAGETVIAKFE
ncbi:phosphatidylserine decarboxylase [bacterium]|nr:phosphatidylserine decarboxylase [bacterium]